MKKRRRQEWGNQVGHPDENVVTEESKVKLHAASKCKVNV